LKDRPGFLYGRARSLAMLVLLGTMSVVSTLAAGYVGASTHGAAAVLAGVLLAFAVNFALFMSAFKLLTAASLSWRELLPGVVLASVFWQLLEHLGGYYIDHELRRTGPLYGVFALVLGLLAWMYLGAQLTIFAAELNVVRARRLWPRSFFSPPFLEADRRAMRTSAQIQQRIEGEDVDVSFSRPPE